MLWRFRYSQAFPLYAARHNAINFPQIVPQKLAYAPLPTDPADDQPYVMLEQGVGDVIFHLAQIKQQGGHNRSTFIGDPKYKSLIANWFPAARFVNYKQLGTEWAKTKVHCSADFVGRSWAMRRSFQTNPDTLFAPLKPRHTTPMIGLCWRGGSGQNRREERHLPLQFVLDMLPDDHQYLVLQFDITDDEKAIIKTKPNVHLPFMDITQSPMATLNLVRELAGVISVDSANWHFAGVGGVPILGIMNPTSHWFWGPSAQVETVYPNATTIAHSDLSRDLLSTWAGQITGQWHNRKPAPTAPAAAGKHRTRPLFVVGLPRVRSSMVMRILHRHGLWMGDTLRGTSANPHGFFENNEIKEIYIKGILKGLGTDPLGVRSLPPLFPRVPYPHLQDQILNRIAKQGYTGEQPWGLKDPKLTLIWPMFAAAFPNANWLIIERSRDGTLNSLQRTPFMARHSTSKTFWDMFINTYAERVTTLRQQIPGAFTVNTDDLIAGNYNALDHMIGALGLTYDQTLVDQMMDQKLLSGGPV